VLSHSAKQSTEPTDPLNSLMLSDSVRAFKERNKIGRFREMTEEEKAAEEKEKQEREEKDKAMIEAMNIGDRWA